MGSRWWDHAVIVLLSHWGLEACACLAAGRLRVRHEVCDLVGLEEHSEVRLDLSVAK